MKTFFEKFNEVINNYNKIVIMAHKNPDLDAFGSSLGLYELLNQLDKDVYIFLNKNETCYSSVKDAIDMVDDIKYINEINYLDVVDDKTLLIILDTHIKDRIYYKEILNHTSNVVVIDHHLKSKDRINNAIILYINPLASSMAEIILYYSLWLNKKISSITSTIMLTGIETDTDGYRLKTTDKTFEAASVLMKYGADNITKHELLKESKEKYLERADYIKSSFMINSKTAICILDNKIVRNEDLSSIAEEMLKFENVFISFAIGKLDDNRFGISARSIGDYDVCGIMKLFGGGGHYNNAAAQIENANIKKIISTISKSLEETV